MFIRIVFGGADGTVDRHRLLFLSICRFCFEVFARAHCLSKSLTIWLLTIMI